MKENIRNIVKTLRHKKPCFQDNIIDVKKGDYNDE